MNIYINILTVVLGAFMLSSCTKFLEVSPEDKFLPEQIFTNETGIHKALNGIYLNMAKPSLYGGEMSMGVIDVFAQYYNISTHHSWLTAANYNYLDRSVERRMSSIWASTYRTIANTNSFLGYLDQVDENVISLDRKQLLLGESYAIRAFLHFDLLRLFGPIVRSHPEQNAIPYVSESTSEIRPILPTKIVIDSILSDLHHAERLLNADPVRTDGVVNVLGNNQEEDFYRLRNRRFNFYAVKALKARVLLYSGKNPEALAVAKELISEVRQWFPWSPSELSLPQSTAGPDRSFSSEVLLGLQNFEMYDQQRELFSADNDANNILAPTTDKLLEIFDNNENDYRHRVNWILSGSATKDYKTFVKYAELSRSTLRFRNFQPLIRLSELYYIAAECEPDKASAIKYLNTVRSNRGLPDLGIEADLPTELFKEYRREFWGEGQTFFYFKRIARPSIPNATTKAQIEMGTKQYVVPLPLSETERR